MHPHGASGTNFEAAPGAKGGGSPPSARNRRKPHKVLERIFGRLALPEIGGGHQQTSCFMDLLIRGGLALRGLGAETG
eukprot:2505155-Alexandrium_andersonii.AAC.1